jgi:hypothetical protein
MAAKLCLPRICGPGGVRAVIAENLPLKQQLIVLRRARQRAPNLLRSDRLLCGFWSLFLSPGRIREVAVALRPSTLLALHQALVRRKYRRLFSSRPCPQETRTERAGQGTHSGHRRTQDAQSSLRLSTNRAYYLAVLRGRRRQEHRAPRSVETLSACSGRHRILVVVVHRPHQRQPVERRPLSMRVDRAPELLAARGHRPVYASPRRHRRAWRRRDGRRHLPHVQCRDSRTRRTAASQYGSRLRRYKIRIIN